MVGLEKQHVYSGHYIPPQISVFNKINLFMVCSLYDSSILLALVVRRYDLILNQMKQYDFLLSLVSIKP